MMGAYIGCWQTLLPIFLESPTFSNFDVVYIAVLLAFLLGSFITCSYCSRWLAAHGLLPERFAEPSQGPTWVEQLKASPRLTLVMMGYMAVIYFATLGGLISAIAYGRSFPESRAELRSLVIQMMSGIWIGTSFGSGSWILRTFARRWCRPQILLTTKRVDRFLWDRDLDHEFASKSRSAS